jgi:hypothetical protein
MGLFVNTPWAADWRPCCEVYTVCLLQSSAETRESERIEFKDLLLSFLSLLLPFPTQILPLLLTGLSCFRTFLNIFPCPCATVPTCHTEMDKGDEHVAKRGKHHHGPSRHYDLAPVLLTCIAGFLTVADLHRWLPPPPPSTGTLQIGGRTCSPLVTGLFPIFRMIYDFLTCGYFSSRFLLRLTCIMAAASPTLYSHA